MAASAFQGSSPVTQHDYPTIVVGNMAQWLGHQSLAGRLSLIYARSMVDM